MKKNAAARNKQAGIRDKSRKWFIISFLAIPTLNLIVFYFVVNFNSFALAFQRAIPGQEVQWTFYNFERLFQEGFLGEFAIIKESLGNTLIFFSFGFFLVNPLTLCFAYFFYKKIAGYRFFRVMFYLPCIIPGVVLSTVFRYIIAPDSSGIFSVIFGNMGKVWPNLLGDSRYAMKTLLVYNFWTGFGINLVLFTSAMNRIPPDVVESAKLDGIGWLREIVSITVPLTWPTISTVLLQAVMCIFTASGPILLFTQGNYGTYTIGYWIFEQVNNKTNMEYASAVGVFFTLLGLPLVFLTRWLSLKVEDVEY